jgi:hypothetical protein
VAPKPKVIDWPTVFSVAEEVAQTEQVPSRAKVANRMGLVESTLNKWARKYGKIEKLDRILHGNPVKDEPEGVSEDGPVRSASAPEPGRWNAEELIRYFGDDPDECVILSKRGTLWGNPGEPNEHLRVNWVNRSELVQAADPGSWKAPPKPKRKPRQAETTAVVIGDHHCPHFEPGFHRTTLEFFADEQPDVIDVNGDLLDFATISRHRERDGFAQPVNDCIQSAFGILRDYREVCPDARITLKRGNHCERLRHAIIDNAKGLHNIAPAGDEVPALDLRRLLHLDELHVEYVDEEWDRAKTKISGKLTVRHGFSTTKSAGEVMLDKLSGSTVQNHDHRFGMTLRTRHTGEEDDPLEIRMALSAGCACIIPGGLGYIAGGEPNWQNAFAFFRVWEDGDFHASPGIYVPGRLLAPNGKRYRA